MERKREYGVLNVTEIRDLFVHTTPGANEENPIANVRRILRKRRVKWFDTRRGFGCIVYPEGNDIFVGDLTLMGVLYNQKKSFALVNNNFIKVGDTLSGYKVSEILKDRIVLKNETGLYVLRFQTKDKKK